MTAHNLLLQVLLFVLGCTVQTAAQEQEMLNILPETSFAHTLTAKERLGPKWTDEQRTDNCKVPIDKRGPKPRSSSCKHGSTN